ncbi:putative reverse transcriptase domain-containing protein [Tanacetum coccineum]
MREVILFYNGLGIPTRQILDSRGAIPSKTAADTKVIKEFRTRDDELDAGIDDYPSYFDYDQKIHIDCATLKSWLIVGVFYLVNFSFDLLLTVIKAKDLELGTRRKLRLRMNFVKTLDFHSSKTMHNPNSNNGWIEEDNEDEVEAEEEDEEEMENEEDEEMEVENNDGENDDAEVYNPYEEADPINRPPPSPETVEREIMNALITQSTLQPIPPIRQFSGTFYVGEGSFAAVFNPALCKVYPLGPMVNDLNALYSKVKTLTKQMWDRFRVESSSSRRLERNDMKMDNFDDDLTALDSTFREQMQEMKKLVAGLNEQFYGWEYRLRDQLPLKRRYRETPYDPSTNPASHPQRIDPYVMVRDNAVRADAAGERGGESVDTTAIVIDVGEEKNDKGDDTVDAKDSQPSETMAPTTRSQTNPPPPLTQEVVDQLVRDGIEAAIRAERERVREEANRVGGPAGGLAAAPVAQECIFDRFMKCGPTQFHRTEGAIRLYHWFEKMENTFEISKCAEVRKVKFATATLHGRALTWWNSQVATLGREVANERPWTKVKQMMIDEFCLIEEVQRLEDELRHLKLKDMNIAAYTERFNELALLCPDVVPSEKKKVELYIKGLSEIIKADRRGGNAIGHAYALRDAEQGQGPNVITSTFLLNNRYARVLLDSGSDNSFVSSGFSQLIDIKPVRLNISYEVELADGKLVNTNTVLRGYTMNLLNQLFEVDLMPIELSTFDVIIGMDRLVKHDALIVCGKKEVHIPVKGKKIHRKGMPFVCGLCDRERAKRKTFEDMPIIRDFPEVFPDDLPGLPSPR